MEVREQEQTTKLESYNYRTKITMHNKKALGLYNKLIHSTKNGYQQAILLSIKNQSLICLFVFCVCFFAAKKSDAAKTK